MSTDLRFLDACAADGCSPDLALFVDAARAHALLTLKRRGTPLVPLVMYRQAKQIGLRDFPAATFTKAAADAQAFIQTLPEEVDACALVMDSYLAADPAGQKKTDAIVIEACQRGQSASFRFAQRYGHSGILRRLKPSAPFEYLGTCAPLLV